MKKFPVVIYQNGNGSCRVYFGEVPLFLRDNANLMPRFFGDIETEIYNLPMELGNHLIDKNKLEIDKYLDSSVPSRFGAQFKMVSEELSTLVGSTFDIAMVEKSL